MLYRDYSRKHGDWIPNAHGGRENLEAIAFLKRMNEVIARRALASHHFCRGVDLVPRSIAPDLFRAASGFHYKWNMGWMHDTLQYMERDPIHRKHHQNEMTFGLVYAFTENFILPLSHDEVVHGKGSLLAKMPGDRWQKFANLRAYYGFMFGHPGKKLLFMGCEFAQQEEWNHQQSLDWHLLGDDFHQGMQRLVRDLNHLYRASPALYERDFEPGGFEWIDHNDADNSVISFIRHGNDGSMMVIVCNFTPTPRHDYRVGVPRPGTYFERLNTSIRHITVAATSAPLMAARAARTSPGMASRIRCC